MSKSRYPFNDWSKTPDGLEEWADSLREIARNKFGVDSDGDCPIRIMVIDRTRYEPLHYVLVPYEHQAKTEEEFRRVETAVIRNLETALYQMQQFIRMRELRHAKQIRNEDEE